MNRKPFLRRGAALAAALTLLTALALPGFAEEEAEAPAQYQEMVLSTPEDVAALAKLCRLDSASQNLRVTLGQDISLADYPNLEIPTFAGEFDGGGHRIYDLTIDHAGSACGLFRYLQEGALVQNLFVEGQVTPRGSACQAGGIVGVNEGRVENCGFTGTVCGESSLGGAAGVNGITGRIADTVVRGYVGGHSRVGGIVGENNGVVTGCVNYAQVNTRRTEETLSLENLTIPDLREGEALLDCADIGGVAGSSSGVLRLCRNEAEVGYLHTGYNVGGVAGSQSGFMAECVNYGNVFARKEGGGIVGQMEPNNVLVYEVDTLQKLQSELQTLQGILTQTSLDASDANSRVQNGLSSARESMYDTLEAMDALLEATRKDITITPPEGEGGLPDIDIGNKDEIWAAAGTLGDRITALTVTLSSVAQNAADDSQTVIEDLKRVGSQMNRVVNLMAGQEENPVLAEDVSGENVDLDAAGKLRDCINYGTVNADINSGGIVGAVSWENDLDPEDDLTEQGSRSLNFTFRSRALVYRCMNRGTIQGKKRNVGGIAGQTTLGALMRCESYGPVDAADADYVGGIAGMAEAEISRCYAKCQISGGNMAGGIAGEGRVITDCRSLVTVENAGENTGAVAGSLGKDAQVSGNYYVESDELWAIDGISYAGEAEGLSYREFMNLDGLPDSFRKMVLTFVADGETVATRRVDYGRRLKDIPEVPEKPGFSGSWQDFDGKNIRADRIVTAVYSPPQTTLESAETREKLPLVLVQGSFPPESRLTVTALSQLPQGAVEGISIAVPEDAQQTHVLRWRVPDPAGEYRVLLHRRDGWKETEATRDGSYLVFTAEGTPVQAALVPLSGGGNGWMLWAAGAALAAAGGAALVLVKKRKNKRQPTPDGT